MNVNGWLPIKKADCVIFQETWTTFTHAIFILLRLCVRAYSMLICTMHVYVTVFMCWFISVWYISAHGQWPEKMEELERCAMWLRTVSSSGWSQIFLLVRSVCTELHGRRCKASAAHSGCRVNFMNITFVVWTEFVPFKHGLSLSNKLLSTRMWLCIWHQMQMIQKSNNNNKYILEQERRNWGKESL